MNYMDESWACIDWIGPGYTSAAAMTACTAGNTYSTAHCARSGDLLGICHAPMYGGSTNTAVDVYIYESPLYGTAAGAENYCTTGFMGIWDPE